MVPVLNTHVVMLLLGMAISGFCTATASLWAGLRGNGSLPAEPALVLVLEEGQLLSNQNL